MKKYPVLKYLLFFLLLLFLAACSGKEESYKLLLQPNGIDNAKLERQDEITIDTGGGEVVVVKYLDLNNFQTISPSEGEIEVVESTAAMKVVKLDGVILFMVEWRNDAPYILPDQFSLTIDR